MSAASKANPRRSADAPPRAPLGRLRLCPGTATDWHGYDYPCWVPLPHTRPPSCANCGQRIIWPAVVRQLRPAHHLAREVNAPAADPSRELARASGLFGLLAVLALGGCGGTADVAALGAATTAIKVAAEVRRHLCSPVLDPLLGDPRPAPDGGPAAPAPVLPPLPVAAPSRAAEGDAGLPNDAPADAAEGDQ